MNYGFDELIDRKNSDSVKWATLEREYGDGDILPMWIADMDFKSSPQIIEALKDRVEHGVFGYSYIEDSFYEAVINWVKKEHNWEIKKEWIVFTPGVVPGLSISIKKFSEEGDKVLVQPPVYPPFFEVLKGNNRVLSENPLINDGDKFTMDYDDLKSKIDKNTKLMILCNPHNPVGRVWSEEELKELGDILLGNNIIVVSDEIHGDLTLKGVKQTPFASISKEFEQNSITFMAPSKTFNIAGLKASVAIIPNKDLRVEYQAEIETLHLGKPTIFGQVGLEVAYNTGKPWLEKAMEYIEDNIDYAVKYIEENTPQIRAYKPDGTYLLWLDFRGLNKSPDEINEALINKGKVLLNDGRPYGTGGEGFFRLNIATARANLEEGLKRIKKAVDSL